MEIYSKIRGVTYNDPHSGKPRQTIIRKYLHPGTLLEAIYEPDNPHGENAIGLWMQEGGQRYHIGYIGSDLAEELGPQIRAGVQLEVYVVQITGKDPLGVNIVVRDRIEKAASTAPVQAHGCWWYIGRLVLVALALFVVLVCLGMVLQWLG